jgi:hypothetical protein
MPARARNRVAAARPAVELRHSAFKLPLLARSLGICFHTTERLSELTPAVIRVWWCRVLGIAVCVSHFRSLRAVDVDTDRPLARSFTDYLGAIYRAYVHASREGAVISKGIFGEAGTHPTIRTGRLEDSPDGRLSSTKLGRSSQPQQHYLRRQNRSPRAQGNGVFLCLAKHPGER